MKATKVCAWCDTEMGEVDGFETGGITHGICAECEEFLDGNQPVALTSFLDMLNVPVMAVDTEGTVITASSLARAALGKELEQVRFKKGGEVMECAYARKPGGCGNTDHCAGCTIRKTVMSTHESGAPQVRVKAHQDIAMPQGDTKVHFLISTEKVNNVVLLRIDEMKPAANF